VIATDVTLRPYKAEDEAAAIELWRRTWQAAYPHLDFAARLGWWRNRWNTELVPFATIIVAEDGGSMIGFVTVEPANGYLDQIVVAPEAWRGQAAAALMREAKRIAPRGLDLHVNTDNARAIGFYRKHGFVIAGAGVNPRSGAAVHQMRWRPPQSDQVV
jgi:putative acetyltransferase